MQIATVNNKLTSKYLLDFEQEKGTPENSIFQEYLDVIAPQESAEGKENEL